MIAWNKLLKNKLEKENNEEFKKYIISQNLNRFKILALIFIIAEILFGMLISTNILPYDVLAFHVCISVLCISIISLTIILIIENKKFWLLKSLLIEGICLSIITLAIIYTYIRFTNDNPDLLLYFVLIFGLDVAIINKPYTTVIKVLGSYLILVVLLINGSVNNLNYSHLFNSLSFVFIAITSSIVSYDNQLKLFLEKAESKKANEKLMLISSTDQLTGLNNRRKIDEVLAFKSKIIMPLSIIMIDIDYFKSINDNYGHQQGDEILKQLGKIINKHLRVTDIAGRWGGEEFIIICNNTILEEANIIAERLRKKVSEYDFSKGIKVNVSMGISQMRENYSIDEVISLADKALYKAKANGRNRVES